MDNNYLDKVVEQIVNETRIDRDERRIYTPFLLSSLSSLHLSLLPLPSFSKHCRDVYGLNKGEIEYVWNEYKQIIKEKIDGGEIFK